ncbi:bromodomain-containing protein DDB_G0270170-like isoform X2 [Microplitis mediator]|uniref:bromodomain-containing protein DDB_G0270170-like isoform X2 n=1 Tax=Microplitis mediator TaxID=375433 RepID=UPI0025567B03|nr:bromodomain-containing protein DDB_G0270170-like isoform X2 [Microplitis mediator]
MIDGNISMEEDTELRDLVVQTLENNGVLAKVRAELRASVFLALEEQESVVNPEPLLNKTVKQYLGNSEGKLLFSLVREFLEYFGLDYTISVYDPETYIGKEYNYMGRNKLCEKLGINSTEPLLGELLKNSINGAFNNSKNETINDSNLKPCETSNINNATFDVSIPKVAHKESVSLSNDNDSSEKAESISDFSQDIPINVTITDKKTSGKILTNAVTDTSSCEVNNKSLRENVSVDLDDCQQDNSKLDDCETANNNLSASSHNKSSTQNNQNSGSVTPNCPSYETKNDNESHILLNKSEHLIKFDESTIVDPQLNSNEDESKSKTPATLTATAVSSVALQNTNNAQNLRKVDVDNNSIGKTVYFEEIIVDGKLEKVGAAKKNESLLGDLPPLVPKTNSIFSDLPPLNGKKTNINDLKELMDIGLNVDNYEEDFVSSASGSTNEQSPAKNPDKNEDQSPVKQQQTIEEKSQSARSEEISEEIDEIEEVLSTNISCLDDTTGDKSMTNFATGNALDCSEEA